MFIFDLSFNFYIYRCISKQNYLIEGSIVKKLYKSYFFWILGCFVIFIVVCRFKNYFFFYNVIDI